ncbi:hypothetical protein [Adhaeribacter aquaticus]|nr:hypothetical protein [Adhaeribacter aquaticus]
MRYQLKYKEAAEKVEELKNAKPNTKEALLLKKIITALVKYHKEKQH